MDTINDVLIYLENGVTELERDYGSNCYQDLKDQIRRALTDLREAKCVLHSVIDNAR